MVLLQELVQKINSIIFNNNNNIHDIIHNINIHLFFFIVAIKSKSEGSLEHAYQKKGVYYPRVVISTEVGGYFELDTNGKSFVVLEDHPEVSGSSAIKSSSILMLLVSLIVTVHF